MVIGANDAIGDSANGGSLSNQHSNHLAITEFIGQDTSDKRHEIHSCQETGKDC